MTPDEPKTATQIMMEDREREANEANGRIFQLSNIIGACIDRIETNPDIVIPALLRVLAVEVVTAPSVMSWELRRANTHRHVRLALAEAKAIFDKAQAANTQ